MGGHWHMVLLAIAALDAIADRLAVVDMTPAPMDGDGAIGHDRTTVGRLERRTRRVVARRGAR
jgi:hypothetical protein